jgi:hypothetical protein
LLFINFTASNRQNNRVTYKNNEEKCQQQDQRPIAIAAGCAAKLEQEYPWQAAGTDVSPPTTSARSCGQQLHKEHQLENCYLLNF